MMIEGPYKLRSGQYKVSVDGNNILFATKEHAEKFVYDAKIKAHQDQDASLEEFLQIARIITGEVSVVPSVNT